MAPKHLLPGTRLGAIRLVPRQAVDGLGVQVSHPQLLGPTCKDFSLAVNDPACSLCIRLGVVVVVVGTEEQVALPTGLAVADVIATVAHRKRRYATEVRIGTGQRRQRIEGPVRLSESGTTGACCTLRVTEQHCADTPDVAVLFDPRVYDCCAARVSGHLNPVATALCTMFPHKAIQLIDATLCVIAVVSDALVDVADVCAVLTTSSHEATDADIPPANTRCGCSCSPYTYCEHTGYHQHEGSEKCCDS